MIDRTLGEEDIESKDQKKEKEFCFQKGQEGQSQARRDFLL